MSSSIRDKFNKLLQVTARILGSKIRDVHTGAVLGRAFLIPWRGRIHLLGFSGIPVYPVFLTQERVTYFRQSLGFTAHPEPDFEHVGHP
ncbi:MAG: hypothetical protein KA004_00765 [Verrucomicrobiales bacterium]|nr:hypothetical protein [Verrucomicrobiales bacterium]